jgi:hypothetical protein
VAWARVPDEADWEDALDDPLVMDLVLTEGGWFQRFLADRGALLPDDEALLASSWLAVDRSVHEIVSVTPDVGLTLRDLRTGDMLDVRERAFTHQARPVPDGESNQLVGGIFPVAPGTEAALLDLLDRGDPPLIATWARELHARPELRTREGEVLVECEITITTPDVARLVAHLDAHYRSDVAGQAWTESHDLDDIEAVIRASFHLDGHRLTITTNSHERADRILDRLHAALDIAVDSDRRAPVDLEAIRNSTRHGLPDLRNVAPDAGRSRPTTPSNRSRPRWNHAGVASRSPPSAGSPRAKRLPTPPGESNSNGCWRRSTPWRRPPERSRCAPTTCERFSVFR